VLGSRVSLAVPRRERYRRVPIVELSTIHRHALRLARREGGTDVKSSALPIPRVR